MYILHIVKIQSRSYLYLTVFNSIAGVGKRMLVQATQYSKYSLQVILIRLCLTIFFIHSEDINSSKKLS